MQPQSEAFDAIVVGSGISGGWAAKELTEHGLRVLMLERGKNVEHIKDYVNARKAPWEYPHRGGRTHAMEEAYPVLKRDYPLNEKNLDWWANEKESPYTEVKRFDWYRGYHVGGRSLMWGRQSYRLERPRLRGERARRASRSTGRSATPTSRRGTTTSSATPASPDRTKGCRSCPTASSSRRCRSTAARRLIAGRLAKQFGGTRRLIPGRVANLTQPLPGRGACQYRNACWLGCPYGAYFSTQSSTLPAAAATGTLTLKPFAIVTEVRLRHGPQARDRRARARRGHRRRRRSTRRRSSSSAPRRSTSTWLLLRSATDVWPGGLGSSSGELGHNLMDHHFRARRQRHDRRAGRQVRTTAGGRPASTFRATAISSATSARTCAASATRAARAAQGWQRAVAELGVGGAFKDEMATPGPWQIGATAFGEMLPNHANKVTLDDDEEGQVGPAGARDRLRHRRERAPDADAT